jgi:ankyrin repeat protein
MRKRFGTARVVSALSMFLVAVSAQAQVDLNRALMDAAWQGDADLVKTLLSKGADVAAIDKNGGNALMTAVFSPAVCLYGTGAVEALLSKHAPLNARNKLGETALMIAAGYKGSTNSCKSVKAVQLLLDAGADVNLKDDRGQTALSTRS